MAKHGMTRAQRSRDADPRSVPWPVEGEYYRGGLHDWITVALPTQPRAD